MRTNVFTRSGLLCGAAVGTIFALSVSPAFAQQPDDQVATTQVPAGAESEEESRDRVVVTGTIIRGVAPVGTNVVGVDETAIEELGATSTAQVLKTLPGLTSFNAAPSTVSGLGAGVQRPNLRNLGASGGNTTLVLVDGHNVVGAGVLLTTPDTNILPPGVLQRVEVMADGGSSLYGADAVGGIINFITKDSADGLEVSAHYGVADPGYWAADLNAMGGMSWENGSGLIAIGRRQNSNLSAFDRDRPRQDLRPFGGDDFRVTTCADVNVTANGVNYAGPAFAPNTLNRCDLAAPTDIVTEEEQTSIFGSMNQAFSDRVELSVTAYWSDRGTTQQSAPLTTSGLTIPSTNPFFMPLGGATSETVSFNWSPIFGPTTEGTTDVEQYGFTPELTIDLDGDWQVKAMFNYGHSDTVVHAPSLNPVALAVAANGTTTATALNPFNLAQTNAAVLTSITDFENFATNAQTLTEYRVIADGPVFSLPGGDVRVAIGADYQEQEIDALSVNNARGNLTGATTKQAGRDVTSIFGQVVVPVIGAENALPFVESFVLDASARYDDYSDFGETSNPKVGFNWDVAGGLAFRGNYGTAFNAPSLADTSGAIDTRASILPISPFRPATSPITDLFRPTIVLAGGNPDLRPQIGNTWSFGADWRPPELDNFEVGLTYWQIKLKDTIVVAPPGFPSSLFTVPAFAQYAIINPTLAQAQAATAGMAVEGAPSIAALYAGPVTPYLLLDARRKNVGTIHTNGLDYYASYTQPTDFGSVFASLSGTYVLERTSQPFAGGVETDLLAANTSRSQLSARVGAMWGDFIGTATLSHSAGYDVTGAGSQTEIDSFQPVDLAFTYNFNGDDWAKDLSVTLNIDNVFDEEVPFLNISPGTGNGSTLGRFFNLGIRKQF